MAIKMEKNRKNVGLSRERPKKNWGLMINCQRKFIVGPGISQHNHGRESSWQKENCQNIACSTWKRNFNRFIYPKCSPWNGDFKG